MLKPISFFILALILLQSCKPKNRHHVDVSTITIEMESSRFDQMLFNSDLMSLRDSNEVWQNRYGRFFDIYSRQMLGWGFPQDPMFDFQIEKFLLDTTMQLFKKNITESFPISKTEGYDKKIQEAFKYYKLHFPDSTIPKIVYIYSNFNADAVSFEDKMYIGLDMYLGSENELVQSIPNEMLQQYVKEKMNEEYIVTDAIHSWIIERFLTIESKKDFLSQIVEQGKMMYLMDAFFPKTEDHLKMKYTKEEYDWCIENEFNVWQYLVDNKLLYSIDEMQISKFLTIGPFTGGLPPESPSRVGIWMGWQIVKDYMENNPDKSIQDLLANQNEKEILRFYEPE